MVTAFLLNAGKNTMGARWAYSVVNRRNAIGLIIEQESRQIVGLRSPLSWTNILPALSK